MRLKQYFEIYGPVKTIQQRLELKSPHRYGSVEFEDEQGFFNFLNDDTSLYPDNMISPVTCRFI